jgi:hypothetical protein
MEIPVKNTAPIITCNINTTVFELNGKTIESEAYAYASLSIV